MPGAQLVVPAAPASLPASVPPEPATPLEPPVGVIPPLPPAWVVPPLPVCVDSTSPPQDRTTQLHASAARIEIRLRVMASSRRSYEPPRDSARPSVAFHATPACAPMDSGDIVPSIWVAGCRRIPGWA